MSDSIESVANLLSSSVKIEGSFEFSGILRFEGKLIGKLIGQPGSLLVLCETSVVEGEVHGEAIVVRGFVDGNITARSSLRLESTARVMGRIHSPSLKVSPGAVWEGESNVNSKLKPEASGAPRPVLG